MSAGREVPSLRESPRPTSIRAASEGASGHLAAASAATEAPDLSSPPIGDLETMIRHARANDELPLAAAYLTVGTGPSNC
jgi:hypothetical protein